VTIKLSFHTDSATLHRQGYWYAETGDSGYDGDGPTPEAALYDLATGLDAALAAETAAQATWTAHQIGNERTAHTGPCRPDTCIPAADAPEHG
jgi:hypothetical protein